MYKVESNFSDLIVKVTSTFDQLKDTDKVLRVAALNTAAIITDRVQQEGKKTDGSQIGKYSEKNLKFKSITGKFSDIANKKQLKKRLKSHGDTNEFHGGYKEFRESLGFQTEFIDLTLTGDMFNDFIVEPVGTNSYEVGFRGEESSKIAGYHEKRFGPIFQLSTSEVQLIESEIAQKINDIFR